MIVDNLEKFASEVLNEKIETEEVVVEDKEPLILGGDIDVFEELGGILPPNEEPEGDISMEEPTMGLYADPTEPEDDIILEDE